MGLEMGIFEIVSLLDPIWGVLASIFLLGKPRCRVMLVLFVVIFGANGAHQGPLEPNTAK